MPSKLCAGHGAADVGPPRPRSCGHVAMKTLNQRVFERHAAVRHERAVTANGSFLFRDNLKPSPTGTSLCSHGAETCLDDAMAMEATPANAVESQLPWQRKKKKKKKQFLDHDDGPPLLQGSFRMQASGCPSAGSRRPAGEDTRFPGIIGNDRWGRHMPWMAKPGANPSLAVVPCPSDQLVMGSGQPQPSASPARVLNHIMGWRLSPLQEGVPLRERTQYK